MTDFDSLKRALNVCTIEYLKPRLAEFPQINKKGLRKADYVALIHEQLSNVTTLKKIWQSMTELQQHAVSETVHQTSGQFDAQKFQAKYGSLNIDDAKLRLFFYSSQIPDDLCQQLKKIVPQPKEDTLANFQQLPEDIDFSQAREYQAVVELHTVLKLVEAGKIRVSAKTRKPTAATIKAMTNALPTHDYYEMSAVAKDGYSDEIGAIKAFAWPMLLQAAKLVVLDGSRLQLTPAGQKALTIPPEKTIKILWTRWLKTRLLDEMRRIDVIKGQTGKGKHSLSALLPRRQTTADSLSILAKFNANWVSVDELFRYMRANDNSIEVCRDDGWSLYVADPNYGTLGYYDKSIVDKRYLLCLLFEYAATLGLIDIAYDLPHDAINDYDEMWGTDDCEFFSRYDGLKYVRLTPLGCHVVLSEPYAPSQEIKDFFEKQTASADLLKNIGAAQVFECKTVALAKKLMENPEVKKHVMLADKRYLIVDSKYLAKVKKLWHVQC